MAVAENDLIIAGGGLSGCLAALALAERRPDVDFLLVEGGPGFGGNHTWSFFDDDVDEEARFLVEPLIVVRWDSYDVAFPGRSRTLGVPYNSVSSERLDQVMRERLRPGQYRLDTRIEALATDHVRLASGETLPARAVIDARGPELLEGIRLGWQKFLGRQYRLQRPHGLSRPMVMDATVDQAEGFRFVYCLPFSERQLLVEDTYYSLSPDLDRASLGGRIEAYLAAKGWKPEEMEREETGILPIALGGSIEPLLKKGNGVPSIGLRGSFFHPTTGYSFPDALRTALLLAGEDMPSTAALHDRLATEARNLWAERRFYRLLNRMLFYAAEPSQRYRVLEHFYRIEAARISRFYAGRSSIADKIRILSGNPPVPLLRALAALRR